MPSSSHSHFIVVLYPLSHEALEIATSKVKECVSREVRSNIAKRTTMNLMTNENGNGKSSDEANKPISFAREKSRCTTKQQEREKEAARQNSKRERKKQQTRAQGVLSY